MKRTVFAVYDSKAAAFLQPFFSQTRGVAVRSFGAAVQDTGHDFNRYAGDYTLFELGTFDEETAKFDLKTTPESIVLASVLLAQMTNGGDDAR